MDEESALAHVLVSVVACAMRDYLHLSSLGLVRRLMLTERGRRLDAPEAVLRSLDVVTPSDIQRLLDFFHGPLRTLASYPGVCLRPGRVRARLLELEARSQPLVTCRARTRRWKTKPHHE
jgi:hypothetical protein